MAVHISLFSVGGGGFPLWLFRRAETVVVTLNLSAHGFTDAFNSETPYLRSAAGKSRRKLCFLSVSVCQVVSKVV